MLLVIALLAAVNRDPVGAVESRARHLPLQHLHLVSEHQ